MDAYLIAGHGGDPVSNTFTVPPGCIIVVKYAVGDLSSDFHKSARRLLTMKLKSLQDPLNHKDDIIKNFGAVAIYTEHMQCPNFFYQLINCFPSDVEYRACSTLGSGIIDVRKLAGNIHAMTNKNIRYVNNTTFNNVDDVITAVADLFKNSSYPTKEDTLVYLREIFLSKQAQFGDNFMGLFKYLLNILKGSKLINTDQKTLCTTRPGIYYNFICRDSKDTNTLFNIGISNGNRIRTYKHNSLSKFSKKPPLLSHRRAKNNSTTNTLSSVTMNEILSSIIPSKYINMKNINMENKEQIERILLDINNTANELNKTKNRKRNLLLHKIEEAHTLRRPILPNYYKKKVKQNLENYNTIIQMSKNKLNNETVSNSSKKHIKLNINTRKKHRNNLSKSLAFMEQNNGNYTKHNENGKIKWIKK